VSGEHQHSAPSIHSLALSATIHCLTGCIIGEIGGMVVGTAFQWSNLSTAVLSIVLAFASGYTLTMRPLRHAGIPFRDAARLALASDTLSIGIMELVDTALMFIIPGAMDAQLDQALFWWSLALSLMLAGIAGYPVNRWLIRRGQGHALVHDRHGGSSHG
jgi:hypothetical protein